MQAAREGQIALLDDDPGVRESLAFLLRISGAAVADFGSVEEFYRDCSLDGVKGMILDHHLPKMTGLEVAGRLRQQGWRFPILLITAAPSPAIAARAAELGLAGVLTKPLAEADIMGFVEAL